MLPDLKLYYRTRVITSTKTYRTMKRIEPQKWIYIYMVNSSITNRDKNIQ